METSSPPIEYKDRSTGLAVFGILTILGGSFSALMILFAVFGQIVSAQPSGVPERRQFAPMILTFYGPLAIVLVWLGIGSILARRWARALLLILAWTGLIMGVWTIGIMGYMAPHFLEAMNSTSRTGHAPDSVQAVALIVIGTIFLLLFVGGPLTWALFYGGENVRATCEARDPKIRWTDRCPLSVLAMSVWLVFGASTQLTVPVSYHGIFPFFGQFISGAIGSVIYILIAVVWIYAAYALYKLDRRGWWLIFVTLCLFSISSAITYSLHDASELYRLVGYSDQFILQVEKFHVFSGKNMAWSSLIYTVPLLAYLLYIRRYFPPTTGQSKTAMPTA